MGIFDNIKKKAAKAVDEHGDKIGSGIDKAVDAANKRTGGKHSGHLDKASSAAKSAMAKLDGPGHEGQRLDGQRLDGQGGDIPTTPPTTHNPPTSNTPPAPPTPAP